MRKNDHWTFRSISRPRRSLITNAFGIIVLAIPFTFLDTAVWASPRQKEALNQAVESYQYPKVSAVQFRAEGKSTGHWRGRVHGTGPTTLILRFFKDNRLLQKRLIGRIRLDNEPNGVLFSYVGTRPKSHSIKWDIIAMKGK
ncbi:hypothetical protein EBR25_01115 [bacterium]|jgi:hypothetical protein|nr:hypothetical protein [bacterium]